MRQALLVLVAVAAVVAGSAAGATSPSLPGTYTTKVSGKKPAAISGEWAIQIKASGDYVILKRISETEGKVEVRGKALLDPKHVVTFARETGPLACKVAGRYRWAIKGSKKLTFLRLHDTCTGRRVVLSGTFKRVA